MKLKDIKVGMRLYDRWWPYTRGKVVEVLKTRIKIMMGDESITYDKGHCQFLERVK